MTTREIYFKNLISVEMSVGVIQYTFKENNIIQIGSNICINFKNNVDENLKLMKNIENKTGFMFWNTSPEGEHFFKNNHKEINRGLSNMVLRQK